MTQHQVTSQPFSKTAITMFVLAFLQVLNVPFHYYAMHHVNTFTEWFNELGVASNTEGTTALIFFSGNFLGLLVIGLSMSAFRSIREGKRGSTFAITGLVMAVLSVTVGIIAYSTR